jgi:hypothetical protein
VHSPHWREKQKGEGGQQQRQGNDKGRGMTKAGK